MNNNKDILKLEAPQGSSFVKSLVRRLALFVVLLVITPSATLAAASSCHILVDSSVHLNGTFQSVMPDSKVETLDGILPEGVFSDQYQFKKSSFAQIMSLFPTETNYVLTSRNSKNYLVFRSRRAIGGYKTTALIIPTPTTDNPLLCFAIDSWASELRKREASIKGLVDHLSSKPSSLTYGESFIEAESGVYLKRDESHSTENLKRYYWQMLNEASQAVSKNPDEPIKQMASLREILKRYGLGSYCRDEISFKSFMEKGCTNCQGQSFLFAALILDLNLQLKSPSKFGVQLFNDHIRPVIYDGNSVLDLVYATSGPDSGDPIFPLKTLLYFALKNQRTELPKNFIAQFEGKDLLEPLNKGKAPPQFLVSTGSTRTTVGWDREAAIVFNLYDFSGVQSRSEFADGHVPEFTKLDLDGNLENPQSESYHHFGNGGARDSMLALTGQFCKDQDVLLEFLNSDELRDLRQIEKTHNMTYSQVEKYGYDCPGQHLSKISPLNYAPYLYIPPELFKRIDIRLPYQKKIELIFNYYSDLYIKNLGVFKTYFALPLASAIKSFGSQDLFNVIYQANRYFRVNPKPKSLLISRSNRDVTLEVLKNFVDYEDHLAEIPMSTFKELSKLDPQGLDISTAFNNPRALLWMIQGEASESAFIALVDKVAPDKGIYNRLANPLANPISKILLSDKFRLSLAPDSKASRFLIDQSQQEAMLTKVRESEGPNVTLPEFPVPGGENALVSYCEKTQSKYFIQSGVSWPCPPHVEPQNTIIPKLTLISESTLLSILHLLNEQMTPRKWIRLLPAMTTHLIENPKFRFFRVVEDVKGAIAGSFYLFSASNPILTEVCGRYGVTANHPCKNPNVTFTKVTPADTRAPVWLKTENDLRFWNNSVKTLYRDFGKMAGEKILNRPLRMSGYDGPPVVNGIYAITGRTETFFLEEDSPNTVSVMPTLSPKPAPQFIAPSQNRSNRQ